MKIIFQCKSTFSIFLSLCLLMIACQNSQSTKNETESSKIEIIPQNKNHEIGKIEIEANKEYDFSRHDNILILRQSLSEISGLAFDQNKQMLLGVNDEQGTIFYIDPDDGKIINENRFYKRGDYEGIEVLNDTVYIIKSNGDIFEYHTLDKPTLKIHKTNFKSQNDIEGLGIDLVNSQLLIACKGQASINSKKSSKHEKSVYQFDLKSKVLNPKPFLTITDDQLEAWINDNYIDLTKAQKKSLIHRAKDFSPSGLAVHPHSGMIYILSSIGKILVVINQDKIQNIIFLDRIHSQPEGICFDTNGTLFISNEGRNLVSKIFVYKKR